VSTAACKLGAQRCELLNVTVETLLKLKAAFEEAGVTWVPENGGPAGTRPPR